jgi:hypothetical protein
MPLTFLVCLGKGCTVSRSAHRDKVNQKIVVTSAIASELFASRLMQNVLVLCAGAVSDDGLEPFAPDERPQLECGTRRTLGAAFDFADVVRGHIEGAGEHRLAHPRIFAHGDYFLRCQAIGLRQATRLSLCMSDTVSCMAAAMSLR